MTDINTDYTCILNVTKQLKIDDASVFDLNAYFVKIDKLIENTMMRKVDEIFTYDILDTNMSQNNKLIVLKEKQRQMKIGEIWQIIIGNYDGFTDLKVGHSSGLDILSTSRKIAIELKNRTNTDNSSSKKSNFDKIE